MPHLDPRTNQNEFEVQRTIHLQWTTSQLPDAFADRKKITKSHIAVENILARIDILKDKLIILQKHTWSMVILLVQKKIKNPERKEH